MFTIIWSATVYKSEGLQDFVGSNEILFYVSLILVFSISIAMSCLYTRCRTIPLNYILLGIYTVAHSYLIACLLPQYDTETILMAAVCTWGMFVGLSFYACFSKKDFTVMGGFLSTSTIMVLLFLILFSFFRSKILNLVIICVVIALLSVWIVYDTQIIIGGKNKYTELTSDDFAIAALIIYSDILTLFIYIL